MTPHLAWCDDPDHGDVECQRLAVVDDVQVLVTGTGPDHLHTEVDGVAQGVDQLTRLIEVLTSARDDVLRSA